MLSNSAPMTGQIFKRLDQIDFQQIVLILLTALALSLLEQRLIPRLAQSGPVRLRHYLLPAVPVIRLLILVVAAIMIFPLLFETNLQNFIAVLGFLTVALGFAFKDYVSSLIAGFVAIYERPYRQGDWVEIGGVYGEVVSINSRALKLFTFDDTMVTIPHLKIWDTDIHNANDGARNLLVVTSFYLDPDHDAKQVRQKFLDVIKTSPYLDFNRRFTVNLREEPWGTRYNLKAYPVEGKDQRQFRSDMIVRGKAALARMGVKPTRVWQNPFQS